MPVIIVNGTEYDVNKDSIEECLVHSCTECCMSYLPGGEFNVKGAVHRALMTRESAGDVYGNGRSTWLDCRNCPVHLNMSDKEWKRILSDMDGTA